MRTNLLRAQFGLALRASVLVALLGLCAAAFCAEPDPPARVPRFSDFPFDKWAAAPDHSVIKWEVHLLPPVLSLHQRLIESVQVVVPGNELEKRRGSGELVVLARFEDSDGRQWRTASRLNLANVQPGVKSQELTFTLAAFVRPGSYRVLVALAFHKTGESGEMEHNFTRRALHVAAIKNDPLPEAWQRLPPVEVLPPVDGADAWFLPDVKGLLSLPLKGTAPQIDLLVNMTPSERSGNGSSSQRRNMSAVLPALKVLSALNATARPTSAAAIDLTHHRIGYETSNAAALDWHALAKALAENNPSIIDAKSLAAQASIRDYFVREVTRRVGNAGLPRWLIVLSGPMAFLRQDETPLPELPPDPNRHIVYLRFLGGFAGGFGGGRGPGGPGGPGGGGGVGPEVRLAPPARVHGPLPGFGNIILAPGQVRGMGMDAAFSDDLERILKPMGAQVIPIATPEVFRKVLALLMQDIGGGGERVAR